jgi:broad-specificity NMP kinase
MQVTDDTPGPLDPPTTVPVLWICGPPGVGKTTVGWKIFSGLADTDVLTGYVDIDQLGNCYPDPPNDPGRYRLQTRNLNAVIATYRRAGARCVVVSGVIDPKTGPHLDAIPDADVTLVRLRADLDELETRFLGRGPADEPVDKVLAEARSYDHLDIATVVDTTGRTADEVVDLVRAAIGHWPKPSMEPNAPPSPPAANTTGPVMLLFGPTGVGKSTIGWQVWLSTLHRGATSAFVDLDQIGFLRPAPRDDPQNHRVKAGNLTAIWSNYRAAGIQTLITVGPIEDQAALDTYAAALPRADLTLVRLHADRDTLTGRLLARGRGEGVTLPGDELTALNDTALREIADSAAAAAAATQAANLGHVSIDTSRQTPDEITAAIFAQTGTWP